MIPLTSSLGSKWYFAASLTWQADKMKLTCHNCITDTQFYKGNFNLGTRYLNLLFLPVASHLATCIYGKGVLLPTWKLKCSLSSWHNAEPTFHHTFLFGLNIQCSHIQACCNLFSKIKLSWLLIVVDQTLIHLCPYFQISAPGPNQLLQNIVQHGSHSVHHSGDHKRFWVVSCEELQSVNCLSSK